MASYEELAQAELANQIPEPGMGPPQGPLRLTVRPAGFAAPPNDLAQGQPWGAPDAETGRPGRLFEPDLEPAIPTPPPEVVPRAELGGFRPSFIGAGKAIGSGLGSLVQGARDMFNAPAPAAVQPQAPRDPTAGPRQMWQQGYPSDPRPTMLQSGLQDVLGAPHTMIEAGRTINDPAATPQQVQQARQNEAGAAFDITSNLAGVGTGFAAARPGVSAGMFGGRLARTFDPMKMKLAETMEANGLPANRIWSETGYMRGADKQWMHEISDLGAYYKGDIDSMASKIFDQHNPQRAGKYGSPENTLRSQIARQDAMLKVQGKAPIFLKDVWHHPALFEAYPELRNMPVSHDAFMQASGGYLPRTKDRPASIVYREEGPTNKMARGQTFDTLLHEVQHAIQQIEGFARGTNPAPQTALVKGTAANAIYNKQMQQAPTILTPMQYKSYYDKQGVVKSNADYLNYLKNAQKDLEDFQRQARVFAAETAYRKGAGEGLANLVIDRKDLTAMQAAGIYPAGMMKTPLDKQKVEFNVLTGPNPDLQFQFGSVLNPTPREMQASSRPAPSGQPKFPQYGERYPEVGPPVQAVDPKTGKEYLAKQLTPEAEAFAKELGKVDKAMAKEGYTPYFDPSKREHVDPKHYPPNVDTSTIIPKKLTEKDEALIPVVTGEEARTRLRAAYQRGTEMPNTKDWYAMKQLEDEFIKELGPEAGRKAFQDKIATSMGATTGGADPTTNWRMAQYGNYLRQNNLPYPVSAHEMPYPIGGRFAGQNIALHKKIFDEGGFPALGKEYPKRHNFSQNFTGNRGAATMDEQMSNLMTPGTLMPPKGRYGYYENTLREEAAKVGVQPQNYQDVAWSGAKNLKDPRYKSGEPFIQTINESIERTHRLTGMPRDEIVRRGLIRSEIPMYGVAGAIGLGSLVDPTGYNR